MKDDATSRRMCRTDTRRSRFRPATFNRSQHLMPSSFRPRARRHSSTPAANTADQTIQPADAAVILAAGAPNVKGADSAAPKGGTGKLADDAKKVDDDKQAGTDQLTADATTESPPSTKVAPQQHADKSQNSSSENDKDRIAAARGEIPTNTHRGEADAPASVSADAGVAAPKLR